MPSRRGFALRPILLALAITHLVVGLGAPLHFDRTTGDQTPARLEAPGGSTTDSAHDPATCALCQLAATQFLRSETTHVALPTARVARPASWAIEFPAARAPPSGHRTRAPPSTLV